MTHPTYTPQVSPEDAPYELQALVAYQRRYEKWRCGECGCGHGWHAQGCPEASGEVVQTFDEELA